MTTGRPAGPILDGLGVTVQLDEDDLITEVLLIGKTVDMKTGAVGLTVASNGLDWIVLAGLHAAYVQTLDMTTHEFPSEDE
jgi:hypothetical protein